MNTSRLLGRTTAGSGAPEEIVVGSGISLAGGTLGLGAITPTSVAASGTVTGSNLSGTNTGDQTNISGYSFRIVHPDDDRTTTTPYPNSYSNTLRTSFKNGGVLGGTIGNYIGVIHLAPWDGTSASTGDCSYQLAFGSTVANGGTPRMAVRSGINTTWNAWYELITSSNIGSQSVSSASTATTANNVNAANNTAAANYYPVFATSQGASVAMGTNSAFYFNPSTGALTATKVYNAVYNDIADYLELDEELTSIEYGRVYVRTKTGETRLSNAVAEKGIIGVTTDTYGYGLGKKDIGNKELPICVGGFTLAFCDQDYEPGTALTCGPNGILVEMPLKLKRNYPERLIATYYKTPTTSEWNGIQVNGRKLVKVI
jgi:hypothetical protein